MGAGQSYQNKINIYVDAEIVGRLGGWGYYIKNNGKDWAAVWIGINKDWEEADKTFIVLLRAS